MQVFFFAFLKILHLVSFWFIMLTFCNAIYLNDKFYTKLIFIKHPASLVNTFDSRSKIG